MNALLLMIFVICPCLDGYLHSVNISCNPFAIKYVDNCPKTDSPVECLPIESSCLVSACDGQCTYLAHQVVMYRSGPDVKTVPPFFGPTYKGSFAHRCTIKRLNHTHLWFLSECIGVEERLCLISSNVLLSPSYLARLEKSKYNCAKWFKYFLPRPYIHEDQPTTDHLSSFIINFHAVIIFVALFFGPFIFRLLFSFILPNRIILFKKWEVMTCKINHHKSTITYVMGERVYHGDIVRIFSTSYGESQVIIPISGVVLDESDQTPIYLLTYSRIIRVTWSTTQTIDENT